jgi:hypothetical protein
MALNDITRAFHLLCGLFTITGSSLLRSEQEAIEVAEKIDFPLSF